MKTVKLDQKKSRFAPQLEKKEASRILEEKINLISENNIERQKNIFELGKRFLELLEDKTLIQNKGPIALSLEKDLLQNLIQFAVEVNTDVNEKEGMGSITLLILVFKSFLSMHETQNQLEFALKQLSERISNLEANLNKHINSIEFKK